MGNMGSMIPSKPQLPLFKYFSPQKLTIEGEEMPGILPKEECRASRLSVQDTITKNPRSRGQNPRNIASFETLCEGIRSKRIVGPALARQFIAYPKEGGRFAKDQDIKDVATSTTLPISDALKLADGDIYQEGIGLLIDVKALDVHFNSQVAAWQQADVVALQAASVTVVGNKERPFIQQPVDHWARAIADEKTGFPLSIPGFVDAWPEDISNEQKMWFFRESGQQGVKPLLVSAYTPQEDVLVRVKTIHSPRDPHLVLFEKR
jgi:hypothetical protein